MLFLKKLNTYQTADFAQKKLLFNPRASNKMSLFDNEIKLSEISEMDGYEHLCKIARGEMPLGAYQELLGMRIEDVKKGELTIKSTPTNHFYNPYGVGHGGYASSLLDTAMGGAVQSICPAGYGSTTLELKVNLVREIKETTGELTTKGNVIHSGKTTATSEARITDKNGKLYAHASCTCLKIKLKK